MMRRDCYYISMVEESLSFHKIENLAKKIIMKWIMFFEYEEVIQGIIVCKSFVSYL